MKTPAATIDDFDGPSRRETPGEHYVYGPWYTTPRAPATPAAATAAPAPELAPEPSLFMQLTTCAAAGIVAAVIIELIIHVVLGR